MQPQHEQFNLPRRYLRIDEAHTRFGERAYQVGKLLRAGDPLADAAVASLAHLDRKASMQLIHLGATQGVKLLKAETAAPAALLQFFEYQQDTPAWVDHGVCARGGEVVHRTGPLAGLTLAAKSIVLGYASPGGNKPLVFAGGLTQRAAKRLNETGRYVRGVIRRGGLARYADGYVASCKVRLMHAQVRAMIGNDPRWSTDDYGVAINQHDMAATTVLFSYALLEGLQALGVRVSRDEAEELMHLWRFAGHLMGVDSSILPASVADAKRFTALIELTQGPPDDDARKLTAALGSAAMEAATTDKERSEAKRGAQVLRAGAYLLLGESLASALGFEDTPWRKLAPIVRRFVQTTDKMQTTLPFGRAKALAAGEKYWDQVQERGLALYDTPFQLPAALAG
jgi:hypothetical protein